MKNLMPIREVIRILQGLIVGGGGVGLGGLREQVNFILTQTKSPS